MTIYQRFLLPKEAQKIVAICKSHLAEEFSMGTSNNYRFDLSKKLLGATLLLVASCMVFYLIFSPQVAWKFSTRDEKGEISSVTGDFGFIENPPAPSLSDPADVAPADAGWESFKVKWTVLSLPGSIMAITMIASGALLLFAGCGVFIENLHYRRLIFSASIIASLCLLLIICLLLLGDSNDPQKLGPSVFAKAENRVHMDDPYVGNGSGYDVVFVTEPGLGFFLLFLAALNAILGTFLVWQSDGRPFFPQSSAKKEK